LTPTCPASPCVTAIQASPLDPTGCFSAVPTCAESYTLSLHDALPISKGFPSKKEEAWKYTSLNSLQKVDFSIFPKEETTLEYKDVKKYFLHEIDTYKIVFVDGVYSSYLSETTHDGVDVCLMSSAFSKPMFRQVIEVYF